jgi:hypothetical protein
MRIEEIKTGKHYVLDGFGASRAVKVEMVYFDQHRPLVRVRMPDGDQIDVNPDDLREPR